MGLGGFSGETIIYFVIGSSIADSFVILFHVVGVFREDTNQEFPFFVWLKCGWNNKVMSGVQFETTADL